MKSEFLFVSADVQEQTSSVAGLDLLESHPGIHIKPWGWLLRGGLLVLGWTRSRSWKRSRWATPKPAFNPSDVYGTIDLGRGEIRTYSSAEGWPLLWASSDPSSTSRCSLLASRLGHWRHVSWKASKVRKSLQVGGRPSCRNFPQRWHGAWNSLM